MKLLRLMALFAIMIALAACSNGEHAGTSDSGTEKAAAADSGDKKAEESKKSEPKLEVVDQTGGAWGDSIGSVWVHSAAVFKNTGDTPVMIGESQMNYKDQSDGILGTSSMIYSVPRVVQPGETAFVGESTVLEGISDPAAYKETSYNFSFDEAAEGEGNILETTGVKGIVGDEWTPYKVTGVVKNTTETLQSDIRLAAGLFDAEGKLLGVLTGSVDVGVNPGGEAGFELSYPDLPEGVAGKVKSFEVKAYGFVW
ncbi:FxLYD domain-containing protein [Bacillus infantis]|uniref:FxLYD domain-containing protein n=1 Tax=Bacillus infantis TaxID=324767 RepID=UPI002FBE721D